MSLTVSTGLIEKTANVELESYRASVARFGRERDLTIDIASLGDEALSDLMAAAQAVEDAKTVRAIESILTARSGDFNKPIPNFKAFEGVLMAFFKRDLIDGWLYVTGDDGQLPRGAAGGERRDHQQRYRIGRSKAHLARIAVDRLIDGRGVDFDANGQTEQRRHLK